MKILELYSGCKSYESVFRDLGFSFVSCDLESFNVLDYPLESNLFDIVFIHINMSSTILDDIDIGSMDLGQQYIEYYNPKYFIILDNTLGIEEDIIMWGLPFKVIKQFRAGELVNTRVWNNIFRWRPRFSNTYILQKTILYELLGCV